MSRFARAGRGRLLRRFGRGGYRTPPIGGAVAQLGERLNGIQEVRGSIPLGSTNNAMIEITLQPVRGAAEVGVPWPLIPSGGGPGCHGGPQSFAPSIDTSLANSEFLASSIQPTSGMKIFTLAFVVAATSIPALRSADRPDAGRGACTPAWGGGCHSPS